MGTIKNAIYKVHNGTDFDTIHFQTKASQVTTNTGSNVETVLSDLSNYKVGRTQADMQIYVSLTGSDSTGDGSSSNPYRTIQKAIDILPKYIFHTITINLAAGDYAETIGINGFVGRGEIRLIGADISGDTHQTTSISIANCACPIFVTGIRCTRISSATFAVDYCQYVKFSQCKSINSSDQSAFRFFASKGAVENCEVRNRQYALLALRSEVYSADWYAASGSNIYGLYVSEAGKIGKYGTQPTGTTANETAIKGGQIV
ncbi:DUF1565 domain-containing protein [Clostridium sp. SYSU_GA19001]|uniref:DUF1565 domain-containing protein n=1 Tax=Clostridium caldaquaticum TaxID=2940653 RepID=UPI0020775435|nr:DUF1565 domain-containing protein [Clostridium caldaquaticum]MCM8710549.1 DUF1565 domain-containing protein [Clostridium caldaquaticum]